MVVCSSFLLDWGFACFDQAKAARWAESYETPGAYASTDQPKGTAWLFSNCYSREYPGYLGLTSRIYLGS